MSLMPRTRLRTLNLRRRAATRRIFGPDVRDLDIRLRPPFIHLSKPLAHTRFSPALQGRLIDFVFSIRSHAEQKREVYDELTAELESAIATGTSRIHPLTTRTGRRVLRRRYRRRFWLRRPPWSKALFRTRQTLFWTALACVPLSMVLFFLSSPRLSVNHLERLNQNADALSEHERAWPLYRDALLALPPAETDGRDLLIYGRRPVDPLWPETRAYLQTNAPAIAKIRRGTTRRGLGFRLDYFGQIRGPDARVLGHGPAGPDRPRPAWSELESPLAFHLDLSVFGRLRRLGRLLAADAAVGIAQPDPDRVAADFEAILRLSLQANESRLLDGSLVAVALRTVAFDLIQNALRSEHPELRSPAFLRRVAAALPGPAGDLIDAEMLLVEARDFVQRTYMPHGFGPELITPHGLYAFSDDFNRHRKPLGGGTRAGLSLLAPIAWTLFPTRSTVENQLRELQQVIETERRIPLWKQARSACDRSRSDAPLLRSATNLWSLRVPQWSDVRRTVLLSDTLRDALRLNLALHQYHHAHGAWPVTLDPLVPDRLGTLPPDPADGQPLRYLVRDDRPVIYSLGADRDDDGGQWPVTTSARYGRGFHDPEPAPPERANHAASRFGDADPLDGDWVLYPQPQAPPEKLPPPVDPEGLYGRGYGGGH